MASRVYDVIDDLVHHRLRSRMPPSNRTPMGHGRLTRRRILTSRRGRPRGAGHGCWTVRGGAVLPWRPHPGLRAIGDEAFRRKRGTDEALWRALGAIPPYWGLRRVPLTRILSCLTSSCPEGTAGPRAAGGDQAKPGLPIRLCGPPCLDFALPAWALPFGIWGVATGGTARTIRRAGA